MLCSLKAYKGIYEFIDIATRLPNISFELVLNAKQEEIDQWKKTLAIPKNCTLFPSQSNTHPFYQRAAVVMNLSRTDEWIETFGMTILEAQAYECYIIAPPVGGPVELMSRYPHGTLINSRKVKTISNLIQSTVDMAMSA